MYSSVRIHAEYMYAVKINALRAVAAPTLMMRLLHRHLFAVYFTESIGETKTATISAVKQGSREEAE